MRTGHRDSDAFFLEASTAVLMRLQFFVEQEAQRSKKDKRRDKKDKKAGRGWHVVASNFRVCSVQIVLPTSACSAKCRQSTSQPWCQDKKGKGEDGCVAM